MVSLSQQYLSFYFSYLAGCFTSAMCGFIGMRTAVYSNTRTAVAAEKGLNAALGVSFTSGSIMGLTVVSVGLFSLSALLMVSLEKYLFPIYFTLSNIQ